MLINAFNDFLQKEDWKYVYEKTVNGKTWEFSAYSHNLRHKFWFMNLDNDQFFTEHMLNIIKEKTGSNYKIDKVGANGQTYGLCGEMHTDRHSIEKGTFHTFIYYPCIKWLPEWGGQTIILDKNNKIGYSHSPIPNSAILFDSTLNHCGLEPTKLCIDLRVTVAYKLTKLN